jgi:hypothetical protein
MRSVSAQAFKDSILLADIYAIRMLNIGKSAAGKYVVGYTGEEFGFRLALTEGWEDTLSEFIGSEPMDFGDVFFMGSNKREGPFVVVAEITYQRKLSLLLGWASAI